MAGRFVRVWRSGLKKLGLRSVRRKARVGNPTINCSVLKTDNGFRLVGPDLDIDYAVEGIDLPQLVDPSFAIWVLLPVAMARGADICLDAPLDPQVARNATKLSRIWEMWVPEQYSAINVHGAPWRPSQGDRRGDITLYSGGVDSTYSLLERGRQTPAPGHVLTIHGLDYPIANQPGFDRLLAKTDPLLTFLNYRRIVIRTNAAQYVRNLSLSHGFVLASGLFLLRDFFSEGYIAADYTPEMDMLVFPWGTNHVTNGYFAGTDFAVKTLAADISRTEKIEALARHPLACSTISFCGDRAHRPENCGVCRKCILTKIRFVAMTGTIPAIFSEPHLTVGQINSIDLRERVAYAAFCDILIRARDRGTLERIPGFEEHLSAHRGLR